MTNKKVVLVTGSDLAEQAMEILHDFEVVFAGRQPTEDELIALCEQHNPVAILVRYGKISAKIMDAAPALQVISKHGSGIDVIDQAAAAERNIAVRSAPGANAAAVAEHTWALILACAKSVVSLDTRLREGHWDKATHKSIELEGLTLGLIGLGAIGSRVAKIGHVFGMRVLAYDPFAKTMPDVCQRTDTLTDLLSRSDVISLHCPLTDENRGMINAETLAYVKRNAILVNTARGGLIDDRSLLAALKNRTLHSAGLDSFTSEPLTAPHLWQGVENVIISPHIGGVSAASYIKMGTVAASNIVDVVREAEETTLTASR
ncbi:3-phosphoglycerate dehydrogenase [Enterobacter cloacae]|uniref:NAD(P)-dependent oxidoreductase n=1 Tax=Enterobacter cloacae TaxID=550 RepID=UPI0015F93578|nr:NAD(P)-dependent oxidoreductase [Enterobacter cloacae]ELE9706860.1 3-phosphoglycerate dehydrogenase [Enterobacter cloacae]ELK7333208.1 3-phosphoglycerate dehydrogenase [Enterobacter cloacae]MBA7849519.1 3-phosphoglycerate dehydrogenase [Enterobacter cloacae]MCK7416723.1 3-phosphoglycerate dehydrogenase [Enterobacter cloacae]MCK7439919.1 3-phosphoglycerate dehydrogenase [Enterobacter cloacae]